jgi:TPR repeat protein
VVNLFLALLPIRPTRLRGSIHRFGDDIRVNVVLENAQRHRGTGAPQWTGTAAQVEDLPSMIEDLAYQIYLTLAVSAAFADARAFQKYTKALESHLRYGDLFLDADRRRAESLYEQAIDLESGNPASLYNLGVLNYYMFEEARNRKAEECFRDAMPAAHGGLRAQIHSGLANVYSMRYHRFKSGDDEHLRIAIHHGEEALDLDESLDVVLKAVALAHHQASEAAQSICADALASGEKEQASLQARTAASHRKKAVTYYQKAIDANPSYYTAHNNLGNLYLELAKLSDDQRTRRELLRAAVVLFKETMSIRPSYHHAYDNLGNAYYELALLGEQHLFAYAARSYRDAYRIEPAYAEAINDLAMLYLEPQWPEHSETEAIRLHREALDHIPDEARRCVLSEMFQERREPATSSTPQPTQATSGAKRIASRARRRRRRRLLADLSLASVRSERRRR